MHSDIEVMENANDVFVSGLSLLHSQDIDSAEKLRRMLNDLIEKKSVIVSNRGRTRSKLSKARKTESSVDNDRTIPIDEHRTNNYYFQRGNSSSDRNRQDRHRHPCTRPRKTIGTVDLENENDDSSENIDVPRISIPDENSDDGRTVCKICKGGKIGPLILLECQECQEAYHPLCHQPAVVEIDVYDPRLVWRCGNCLRINDSDEKIYDNFPLVVTIDDDEEDEDDETKSYVDDVLSDAKTGTALESIDDRRTTKIIGGRTRSKAENLRRGTLKNSSARLKKRVGSKLSLIRLSPS